MTFEKALGLIYEEVGLHLGEAEAALEAGDGARLTEAMSAAAAAMDEATALFKGFAPPKLQ